MNFETPYLYHPKSKLKKSEKSDCLAWQVEHSEKIKIQIPDSYDYQLAIQSPLNGYWLATKSQTQIFWVNSAHKCLVKIWTQRSSFRPLDQRAFKCQFT